MSTAFSVVFGKRTPRSTTPEVAEFFAIQRGLELLAEPHIFRPIDFIPVLRWASERWAGWKKLVVRTRCLQETLYSKLYEETMANIAAGKKNGCWMETVVERGSGMDLNETQMACVHPVVESCGSL